MLPSTTDAGFLVDVEDWSEEIAEILAARLALQLTEAHWDIIRFMRAYYLQFNHLPNARLFTKAVENEFGKEKGNSRYLYRLFPDGPLKCACLIAGLPKPPSCI